MSLPRHLLYAVFSTFCKEKARQKRAFSLQMASVRAAGFSLRAP